jgi:hypothetical protein
MTGVTAAALARKLARLGIPARRRPTWAAGDPRLIGPCYTRPVADGDAIDLTLKRLQRLEDAQTQTNERLERMDQRFGRIEDSLGRIVVVLEAHDQRLEQVVERLDRLIDLTMRRRTEDDDRMAEVERRLRALEDRQAPTT